MKSQQRFRVTPVLVACLSLASSVFSADLAISEFVAVSGSGMRDSDGELSDWLEISNYGKQTQELDGYFLTDDSKKLDKWKLPAVSIEPGKSVVVFASGKDRKSPELHANFSLSEDGEFLGLVAADRKTVVHAFAPKFPPQKPNTSYGLIQGKANKSNSQSDLSETYFLTPTPGTPNQQPSDGNVLPVEFSVSRGFFDQPFSLELTCETNDATIRYSTDGSDPSSENGFEYSVPLSIDRTMSVRAVAAKPDSRSSAVETHTFILPARIADQSPEGLPPEGFPFQWGQNRVDYGMDPAITKDPSLRKQLERGFHALPSFSIVTEMDHLFDGDTGIYARAQEDGRDWERPTSVELIHPDGDEGFQINCGLRIRGGFSRMPRNPKHAFRLFFRKEYGKAKLKYPLFGEDGAKEFDNLDLRTFQNYSWSLAGDPRGIFMRDQFSRDLQRATGQPSARGEYCHLFVNGHYWGLYNTCERPKAAFAASYMAGKKKDFDVVKQGRGGNLAFMATDGNLDAWREQWNAAKGLASNANYFKLMGCNADGTRNESYSVLLNPKNLIDYMLVIFFAGNFDSPVTKFAGNRYPNNWYGIRNRNGTEGFRYLAWDAEHSLLDLNEDRTGPFPAGMDYASSNPQWIYQQCLDNAEFRTLVADRIYKHFFNGGALSTEATLQLFRKRAAEIEDAVVCESARWGDSTFGGQAFNSSPPPKRKDADGKLIKGPLGNFDWQKEVNRIIEDYLPRRSQVVLGQFYQHGLIPEVSPPQVTNAPTGENTFALSADLGDLFYTLDGSDPRVIGGAVSSTAKPYKNPIVIGQGVTLKARAKLGDEWSALHISD